MLADPQSVTYDTVVYSLPRVGNDTKSAVYRDATNTLEMKTMSSETKNGRQRYVVSLRHRKVATDPFNSTLNAEYQTTISLSMNTSRVGFSSAERALLIDSFLDALRASTDALPNNVVNGQL